MVRREGEPDQSVACLDQHGITINLDSTTFWRVDPSSVADLYELRPDIPLTSTDLNTGIGNIIVRRLARGVMHDVCGEMSYQDIFGPKRATFVEEVQGRLRTKLAQFYIILDGFQLGSVFLQPDQQKVFAEQAQAEQAVTTAQAAAERARREAEAAIIQAESRKQVSIKEAEGDAARTELAATARAEAARTEAAGEADAIRLRQQALAESPDYRTFQLGLEQARHQPSTYVGTGAPATALINIPPPAAEPAPTPPPAAEPSPSPTPKKR
jgi:regulator of protease activity HflC (stomatin/prohibitin superfamily)